MRNNLHIPHVENILYPNSERTNNNYEGNSYINELEVNKIVVSKCVWSFVITL
jgi:hypothetical protein